VTPSARLIATCGRARIDRGGDINRGAERRVVGLDVVGRIDGIDFDQADPAEARHQPRGHPLAGRIDDLRARGRGNASGRDDPAVLDDHRATLDRIGPIAERDRAAGDGDRLGEGRGGEEGQSSAHHRSSRP
jgi:hypothetical protein